MRCALGFSLHSGWAVAVAVAGSPTAPEVLLRRRIQLVADDLPRQPYHAAAAAPTTEGERIVGQVERSATQWAEREVAALRDELAAQGNVVSMVAMCAEPREVPADLGRILANHALIHSAEGELYREALQGAVAWVDLPALHVHPKHVSAEVSGRLGLTPDQQKALVDALGRDLGPPWQADHKQATLLALVALDDAGDRHAARQR